MVSHSQVTDTHFHDFQITHLVQVSYGNRQQENDRQLKTKHSGLNSSRSSHLAPSAANSVALPQIDPVCLLRAPVPAE